MDFLRRHLFLLVSGIAGVGGIALIVTGARAMPDVLTAMEEAEGLYKNLKHLKSNPANEAHIDAEQRRIDRVKKDCAQLLAKAKELHSHELLVEGVLPSGNNDQKYKFQAEYAQAMRELMDSLDSNTPPTASQFAEMRDRIAEDEHERREHGLDANHSAPPLPEEGPPRTPAGVLTAVGVRTNVFARTAIQRAQQIRCYAVEFDVSEESGRVPSLAYAPYILGKEIGDEPPELEDIWRAQLGYWIQKDVVDAIVAVNEEAAAKLTRDERWVGMMPVKEVVSIRLSDDVVPPTGEGDDNVYGHPPGGSSAALPPGVAETVFTGLGSGPTYDVIQFTVKLIMDQRDIPLLIERLCANRFHTPLRVAYKAVPVNKDLRDKVYGPEPTVNVVMDFETILLDEVFGPLKPVADEDEE